jgi:microcystin-dependent protein
MLFETAMKNYLFIFIVLILTGTSTNAQVGIGNATPNAQSILDLTNSNNKYVVLPISTIPPSAITPFIEGSVIYYKGNLYLKTATGMLVFTPWKWDGDSTHAISSPAPSQLGIGISPQAPHIKMQVADSGEVSDATSMGAIAIGNINGKHMLMDNDEIMAKTNPNTAGLLKFQEEGGTVQIRSNASKVAGTTVLTAYGNIDSKGKVKENGNDLLPPGAIIMWNGSAIPAGWALCDGGTYTWAAGGTTTAPNLMDRFIIAGNATGGTGTAGAYALGNTGGNSTITLSIAQMPSHDHGGSTSTTGAHTHDVTYNQSNGTSDGGGPGASNREDGKSGTTVTSTSAGDHAHTIAAQGSGSAIDIRPKYYALAYIMKL